MCVWMGVPLSMSVLYVKTIEVPVASMGSIRIRIFPSKPGDDI